MAGYCNCTSGVYNIELDLDMGKSGALDAFKDMHYDVFSSSPCQSHLALCNISAIAQHIKIYTELLMYILDYHQASSSLPWSP